jgi:hypothetical protein
MWGGRLDSKGRWLAKLAPIIPRRHGEEQSLSCHPQAPVVMNTSSHIQSCLPIAFNSNATEGDSLGLVWVTHLLDKVEYLD